MPYPSKYGSTAVFLAKEESTYATAVAVAAATDAHLLAISDRYQSAITKDWMYKGDLGPAAGNFGSLPKIAKAGAFYKVSVPARLKGAGAAYAAGVKNSHHPLLKACGLDATGSFGGGSEKWTFAPTADGTAPTSLTCEYYHGLQKYAGVGALGTLSYEGGGGPPPIFTFDFSMIANGDVTEAALPSATYPALTVFEPGSYLATITIGSFLTAAVRNVKFVANRKIDTTRPNMNGASSHLGFVAGGWDPMVTVTLERTVFQTTPFHNSSGLDAYKLSEAATQIGTIFQFGSAQYNRMKHNMAQSQLFDVRETSDGALKLWELDFVPISTTPGSTYDFLSLVFD